MGTCIKVISWKVTGVNCLIKRGDIRGALRRLACDIAVLQECKLEMVGHHIVLSLWGRHHV